MIEVIEAWDITGDIPEHRMQKGGRIYRFSNGETLYIYWLPELPEEIKPYLVEMPDIYPERVEQLAMMDAIDRWNAKRGN